MTRTWRLLPLALVATLIAGACSTNPRSQLPAASPAPVVQPSPPAAEPPAPAPDPIAALIAQSERHFADGERELKLGHLDRARHEFDRAVDVLLESPDGVRTDVLLREHFDRLVDRITAYEMTTLAQGDGFTEQKSEPATIDELLAVSTFVPEKPAHDLKEAVAANLESTAPDVPVPLNGKVLAWVEAFQGKLKDWIQEGFTRGTRYMPMIESVFRAEGLPLDLAYVALIESAFKPTALSRAKAKGVWQFMKGTARENGLKEDWYIDERSDPEKATRAAARYLRTLHDLFDGDWHLALASYNGGPSRVQRAMRRSGLNDFWALASRSRLLPRETREYVPMILAAIVIAKNPTAYGFKVAPQPPITYDTLVVPQAIDLRRVAEWTGGTIDEIQALNPELRRWTTPVRYPGYEVKVPAGTSAVLEERIAQASPAELTALNWYTVRRGESIATIARKLKVNRTDLAAANYLSVRSRLRAGQQLIIPRPPALGLAARVTNQAADVAARSTATDDTTAERARVTYRVRRGDTLSSIARTFQTTVASLKEWNNLRTDRITVGDRLNIYTSRTSAAGQQ